MSDQNDYLRTGGDRRFRLRADGLSLMLKGAGYAVVFCLVISFGLTALVWAGKMLPEQSRETPDPPPFSFNLTEEKFTRV